MTLSDHQLISWATLENGIEPFEISNVGPASIDLRIGTTLEVEASSGGFYQVDISDCTAARPFLADPGEFIKAHTEELVWLPSYLEGIVCLRSSAARAGWDHALAAYIDPAWKGQITLEFRSNLRYSCLPLYPGQKLVQIRVNRLESPPNRGYQEKGGRYYGDMGVHGNKDATIGSVGVIK